MKIFDYNDLNGNHSWDYSQKGITPDAEGIEPILETDQEINMGDVLIINKVAYYVCSMAGKGNVLHTAYVEKLKEQKIFINNEEPEDKNYMSEVTCPYCGAETESWEMEESNHEYVCDSCHSTFSYQRKITVEYCSQPVKRHEPKILS